MVGNPGTTSTENIDEVILRLLKIKSGTEIDYQTYFNAIKKRLAAHRMVGAEIPIEEDQLLREELKRVGKLKDKGRFKVKSKTVKVSPTPGPSTGGGEGMPPKSGAIIKASPEGKIIADRLRPPQIEPVNVKDITEKTAAISKKSNPLVSINEKLDSIINTLTNLDKENRKEKERQRKNEEQKRRSEKEKGLESKTFEGLKKVISAVTKPFQSIWERILNFIFYTLLGKVMMKLLDWFADPKNKDKIQSLIRFVKDWWPALLGSYILFGTSFGKLTRSIVGTVGRFIFQIGKVAIPSLLRVIAANPITSLLIGGAVAAGVGAYVSTQQNEKRREEFKKKDPSIVTPRETREQGKTPGTSQLLQEQTLQRGFAMFNGGGYANYGNLLGGLGGAAVGAGFGSMFGPLGMLAGAALGSGKPQEIFSGLVSGPGGPKGDKIPAMLSDGEFVMSAGAVQKYGVDTLESMNAAGGGDNTPVIKSDGIVRAAGGGLIGDIPLSGTYGTNPSDDALRGAARTFSFSNRFGSEEDLFKTFKKLNGVPDIAKMVGGENNFSRIFQGHHGADDALDAIRQSVADKLKAVNNPQSFTQSSRAAAGLDDLAKKFDMDAKTAPRYGENLPRLNTRTTRINPKLPTFASQLSPSYFLRGQSSLLPEDYFLRGQSSSLRTPLQQSSFNRYRPGATIRATGPGMEFYPELQRFANQSGNMRPRGSNNFMRLLNNPATRFAGKAARVLDAPVIGDMILPEGTSEYDQRTSVYNDPRLSPLQRRIMMESVGLRGGGIKGGYGLKEQSFKDAPKTQVMVDEKTGKPFVGYKALRGGKLVYIRGPQPGTGTTNPFEALGRMINPSSYKDIDAANERKKYEEASKNSISSLRARGASQATISRTQRQLRKPAPPLPKPKPKPKVQVAGGGMGGGRGSGSNPSAQRAPSPSPRHRAGTRTTERTTGTRR